MESFHLDMFAYVNAFVHTESDMDMHDVDKDNDGETENVGVVGYHHDARTRPYKEVRERTSRQTCRRPTLTIPRRLTSLSKSMMPTRYATRNCDPSLIENLLVFPNSRSFTFAYTRDTLR